ncbi:MAG TPA: hypothetical protein VFO11_02775 [Candidatus Polarisedimenticolaceae bacterium]|nr:hypothetical protein [Candidatus Polarisedimenticolaceae bacterium]
MRDDYLWDKKGEPDPDIERLEGMLRRFRQAVPPPDFHAVAVPPRRNVPWLALAATIALVGFLAGWWASRPERPAVRVASLAGAPRIGGTSIAESGRLRTGQDLVTDGASRARIEMGLIGEVEVEPRSRVGLVKASPGEHRLSLRVGTLHARIWAPPRLFFVDTPSATAVDLGCAYTLTVDEAGASRLTVTTGWVAFEHGGRESFVPEGAVCLTRPGIGPGTPYREEAPPVLRQALERLDFDQDPAALDDVLGVAGEKDALSLWHLLTRTAPGQRERVYDRLAALLPPPAGVTREGIVSGDREMLDRWWGELGLGSASWWRTWKAR